MAVVDRLSSGIRTLRALSSGSIVAAGEPGYDEARMAWNLAADQHPAAVAMPVNETDVAFAIGFARDAGLRVNVQGTGHNAMPLGAMGDTLLIKTSRMRDVEIDVAGRRARVQAGALWEDVVPRATEHGLTALHGSSPDVGITGYSLGGGIGYLARTYGMQANAVTALELVTADGELTRVDADHDPDLFWALRGGGGNFGVVTALEFRLLPVESVYGGMMLWPGDDGERVIGRWAEWTAAAPEEITSMARLLRIPDMDGVPDFMRGREVTLLTMAYVGSDADGERVVAPLRELGPELDMVARMPAIGLSTLHGDPDTPVPAMSDTLMLDSLPADAVSAFVERTTAGPALMMAELRHVGGAVGRVPEGAGALGALQGDYVLFAGGMAATPEMGAAVERDARELVRALEPYGHGSHYLNFAERRVDTGSAYRPDAYARLAAIRASVDPDGLFRANHEIA
jgi:FAD/FMN-containing dehydrogenase